MSVVLGTVVGFFFIECIQAFGTLRLLGRATPGRKIAAFAALQALFIGIITSSLPTMELGFLLVSVTHFLFYMGIFQVGLYPDALFSYLIPISLYCLGRCIFTPLFSSYFPLVLEATWLKTVLGASADLTAYLPSVMLACFMLVMEQPSRDKLASDSSLPLFFGWFLIFLGMAVSSFHSAVALKEAQVTAPPHFVLLGIWLIAFPILAYLIHQYSQRERQNEKVLQYHVKRSCVQEAALRTLREERHDLLNELTLISTYVQMGKVEEALHSIHYSAAKLSDRHNYSTLPADAWSTVLQVKQAEAERLSIAFSVDLQASPPEDFHEQRLLPKVIMNLVDNAFAAVDQREDGLVTLSWMIDSQGKRMLAVSNNGPEITALEGLRIFRGGVTSKPDSSGNHGWGLVICKRIAEELGGTLTFTSSPELTTFTLTLPPAGAQRREQVSVT